MLNKPRPCLHCGKEFSPKRSDAKYCSKECNTKYWNTGDRKKKRNKKYKEKT